MSQVAIKNLFKFYDAVEALHGLNLQVEDGEFFVLLGPSGAGKSTLLKLLAGVVEIDIGDIYFGERRVNDIPPHLRNVAITFETYALYAHLNVYDNMAFPLRSPVHRKDYSSDRIDSLVKKWAKFLQIDELLERLPQQLSGGQRQRVAIGRMLVREPELFLMDEPIAHLDAKLRHFMRAELKNVQKDLGITMIYSTPDQLEALSMGDRIAVLNNGVVQQVGAPNEVYNLPANEWVANFIADIPMNIFPCRLQQEGDDYFAVNSAFKTRLTSSQAAGLAQAGSGDFDLGIRPHRITLAEEKDGAASIPIEVSSVETSGSSAVISTMLGDFEVFIKQITSKFPVGLKTAWINLSPDSFFFFNSQTKKRYEITSSR